MVAQLPFSRRSPPSVYLGDFYEEDAQDTCGLRAYRTRLGHEHLKRAYELVLPVQRRTLTRSTDPKSQQAQPSIVGKPQAARSKP
jgi:hypothetical protein